MFNDGKDFRHSFESIISVENLLAAWREFLAGKRQKADVQLFQHALMDNILLLHRDLAAGVYAHGPYFAFKISDPKPRDIHKASVRDRLLHHALYRVLYPIFDRQWITDSYSCREQKGTHKAMKRFRSMARKVTRNHTRTAWVLKCDIRKFFASVDHQQLLRIVQDRIPDARTVALIANIVGSFHSTAPGRGLPLGNLTSQLLVNAYMNEFDQFVKHDLRARYYIRYADDFVFLAHDRASLETLLPTVREFLRERLLLELHPGKVYMQSYASGVDFLGWVHFTDHQVLRTSTKRRMQRNLTDANDAQRMSYLGLLAHGNTQKLRKHMQTVIK